jgi:AcrR family transcriptional regulator
MKSNRRLRNRELTIQTILDTARAIMREEGVAALSMQELARRMDMRAPSLYNYFSGKMEIYDTLFRLGFTLYDEHRREVLKEAKNIYDEIRLSIEAYMSFALEHPELYQLCFERHVPEFIPSKASLELSFGLLHKAYEQVDVLREVLETDLSSQQLADTVIAITHGLTALHLANEPDLPIGQGRFGSLIPIVVSILETAWPLKGDSK